MVGPEIDAVASLQIDGGVGTYGLVGDSDGGIHLAHGIVDGIGFFQVARHGHVEGLAGRRVQQDTLP